jgi:hypothetical protein
MAWRLRSIDPFKHLQKPPRAQIKANKRRQDALERNLQDEKSKRAAKRAPAVNRENSKIAAYAGEQYKAAEEAAKRSLQITNSCVKTVFVACRSYLWNRFNGSRKDGGS